VSCFQKTSMVGFSWLQASHRGLPTHSWTHWSLTWEVRRSWAPNSQFASCLAIYFTVPKWYYIYRV
jgi:hypothetical protein